MLLKQPRLALVSGFAVGFICTVIATFVLNNNYYVGELAIIPMREPELVIGNWSNEVAMPKVQDMFREESQWTKLLCWVMTHPKNHEKVAKHVKLTWGKRCNVLLFMSSQNDSNLPAVGLPVPEGHDELWKKTKEALKYIHKHHLVWADWILKADDDTFVILDNLRYLLSGYNSSEALYFGSYFKTYRSKGYMSGGAGYVLSKEALRRFIEEGLPNVDDCKHDSGPEDKELGVCLAALGVRHVDSRDSLGRARFFPFDPKTHLLSKTNIPSDSWYWRYIYYPSGVGLNSCSHSVVSFHYVEPHLMYVIDYLLYSVKLFSVNHLNCTSSCKK